MCKGASSTVQGLAVQMSTGLPSERCVLLIVMILKTWICWKLCNLISKSTCPESFSTKSISACRDQTWYHIMLGVAVLIYAWVCKSVKWKRVWNHSEYLVKWFDNDNENLEWVHQCVPHKMFGQAIGRELGHLGLLSISIEVGCYLSNGLQQFRQVYIYLQCLLQLILQVLS